MYKKNSILDRPLRPPSARNVENGPIEHREATERDTARFDAKYRRWEDHKGFSCRNQWEDPQHWQTTSYDKTHRLQTRVTEHGLVTVPRADVDILSGVMKIPAPWDRMPENCDPNSPSGGRGAGAGGFAEVGTMGMGMNMGSRGGTPSTAAGTPHRLLHGKSYLVPEDDPALGTSTQRRPVELPKKMDGNYNPITHQWTVPPNDTREMDREALPSGLRGKGRFHS